MGYGAVYDLVHNSPDVESVTVADFDFKKAEDTAKISSETSVCRGKVKVRTGSRNSSFEAVIARQGA